MTIIIDSREIEIKLFPERNLIVNRGIDENGRCEK